MLENDIRKGLDQEAQRITERNPVEITEEAVREVAEALKEFLAKHSYTQSSFARAVGVSPTAINKFLSGKYKGNLKDLINKINNCVNSVDRRQRQVKGELFINTTVAHRIKTLITNTESFSDREGKVGLIVGDSGHGKSHCLRAYAKANLNSIYIELDDSMTSTKLFAAIAKELNRRKVRVDVCGNLSDIAPRLVNAIRDLHLIVVLDEASGLSVKQLNQLRQIIVVKGRCPLILAGNSALLSTVTQPTARRGCESLDQFASRLMQVLNLDELALDDDDLYTIEDVRKLYEYGGVRLTADGADALRRICKTPQSGRLRTCKHVIAALHTSQVVCEKGVIDAALIIAAIEQLDLPFKFRLPFAITDTKRSDKSTQAVSVAG